MSKSGSYNAPDPPPPPPLLWGDWRCTDDARVFVAECAACAGELWIHRRGFDEWRASCANGCAREAMDAAASELLREQRADMEYQAELKATMEPDDPFWNIEATRYIEALTGQEASRGGFFRCPFHGDGNERTPSLHATDLLPARWYCFACHQGGTIYDFAALLWGIEPRADGFAELRERLGRTFIRAAASPSSALYWPDDTPL
jgi:hypothetical protein